MGWSVSEDTLQYRLKESVSHRRTRQVKQLFTYLLTQRRTAATPTSVCLLMRHDSARRPRWPSTIAESLSRYRSGTQRTAQGKDFELILTVKIETRHPVGDQLSVNHCGVMAAWSHKTWKCCEHFFAFLGKTTSLKLSLLRGSHPKSARACPTFGSQCSRSHPYRFTFGRVIAERVKTVFVQ